MARINFENDMGEAIVYKGKAYRRVGKVKGAVTDTWPDGPNDMYNITTKGLTGTDPSGRRYYSAEETALAFLYHTLPNGNRNGVPVTSGVRTLVFTAPAAVGGFTGGIYRLVANAGSGAKANVYIGGILVKPDSQFLAAWDYDPDNDNGNMQFSSGNPMTWNTGEGFTIMPGEIVEVVANPNCIIWSIMLPFTYS